MNDKTNIFFKPINNFKNSRCRNPICRWICNTPISTYVDNYSTELPVEEVDFEYNNKDIESIHYLDYVMLDNWYEDLRSELISTYQELGYIWLKDYELDPFNSPGNTEGLCFVKIKNVRYEEVE